MSGFRINRDEFLAALGTIAPAQKKTLLPILSCALVRSTDGGLSVTASDLDLTITKRFGTEAPLLPVAAAVLLTDLLAVMAELPAGMIEVDFTVGGKMTLRSGRARLSLQTMSADEFPIDRPLVFATIPIPWGTIAHALERVLWAAATNDTTQPLFNGISWRAASGALYLAATNRYQLASATLAVPTGAIGDANIVIPARAIGIALKTFSPLDDVFLGVDAEG